MVRSIAPKDKGIHWHVVIRLSVALCVVAVTAGVLWPQPRRLPVPAPLVEPLTPWAPTPALETSNDLAVLRTVLSRSCAGKGYSVLASAPDKPAGQRSSGGPSAFPAGLQCRGVKLVDSVELDRLFDRPYRGKKDFIHQGGWGNFYQAYPEASGIIHLSLPAYTSPRSAVVKLGRTGCFLCGAGWEVELEKIGNKWVIRQERPSWIA